MTPGSPQKTSGASNPDINKVKLKIARYCAYQERAHYDVKHKLYSMSLPRSQVEEIMAWLVTENYLNEERFAIAFAGGKFRVKGWGRNKIRQELEQKEVSSYCINKALSEIEDDEYQLVLRNMIAKRKKAVKAKSIFELRHKISRYVIGKGYEPELVWSQIMELIPDNT